VRKIAGNEHHIRGTCKNGAMELRGLEELGHGDVLLLVVPFESCHSFFLLFKNVTHSDPKQMFALECDVTNTERSWWQRQRGFLSTTKRSKRHASCRASRRRRLGSSGS
jgi:hypothetical protein